MTVYFPNGDAAVEAMRLLAVEPGDPVEFTEVYPWYEELLAKNLVNAVGASLLDGNDWTYLWIDTPAGVQLLKTDDWLVRTQNGRIGVITDGVFQSLFGDATVKNADREVCGTTKTDDRYGVRACTLLPGHIKHGRNFHVANVGPGWLDEDSDREKN